MAARKESGGAPQRSAPRRRSRGSRKAAAQADPELFNESVPDTSISDSFYRIGGKLTPERVSLILAAADSGRPELLVDLTHESRQKDGHLHSVLQTRELGIKSLEWDVVAPGDDASPEEQRAAAELKEALAASENFPELLAHMTGEGNLFGHVTSEVIWKVTPDARTWPDRFKNISCRRFSFRQSDGKLVFGTNPELGIDLFEEFSPGKFIQWRPRVNGDVTVREGLCRILVWLALFRNWDIRDWLQLAEMAWRPKQIAKYKKEADKREILNLDKLLQRIDKTGQGKHSENIEIDIQGGQARGATQSLHRELAVFCAGEMSKTTIGQTTSSEPGENGSRASDQVRDKVRGDIRDSDAMGIAATLNRHLSKPFVALNYGESVRAPVLFLVTEERKDLNKFAEFIERLRKAGFPIPQSYVRDQTGIPERKGDEPVLGESEAGDEPPPENNPDDPEQDDSDTEEAA